MLRAKPTFRRWSRRGSRRGSWSVCVLCLTIVGWAVPAAAAEDGPHWGYNCAEGAPFVWGEIAPAFTLCAEGRAQSPIDVITTAAVHRPLPPLSPAYGPVDLEVVNNGHTVESHPLAKAQAEPPAGGPSLQVGGRTYRLVQFHWHTPSEHWLDGASYPMELHLVHGDEDGRLVLGVLIREGRANPELDKLWATLPREPGERTEVHGFDLAKLLPASLHSYRYAGSLTTPPCDQGIQWVLLAEPIELSAEQIATFQELFLGNERFPAGNARPLQPHNDREITTDAEERCAIDGPLGGAWEATDGHGVVRFFDRRYAVAFGQRLDTVAPVVGCRPDRVEICSYGRRQAMAISVSGDRLEIHDLSSDTRRSFERLDTVPEVFDPKPLEIAPAGTEPLPADRLEEIREQLADRLERDQEVREPPLDASTMDAVDTDNTAYLRQLVAQVGWIDPERFGEDAANAAFLFVQHSGDMQLMAAALPQLEAQHRLQEYALLYDRIQIRQGLPQRYGTQLGWADDGSKGLLPIETLDGIDALRATMALEPLDEYLAHFDLDERRVLNCR